MKIRVLKNIFTMSLAIAMLFNLTACENNQANVSGSSGVIESSETSNQNSDQAGKNKASEEPPADEEKTSAEDNTADKESAPDEENTSDEENASNESIAEDESQNQDETNDDEAATSEDEERTGIPGSETELLEFLEGDWSLVNTVTGDDYAAIEIASDGSFTYGYTGSDEKCEGRFAVNNLFPTEENVPLSLSVKVKGLDKMTFDESMFYVPDDGKDNTDCKIYFGSCDGEDYLFMEETGNGDTFTMGVLFQDQSSADGSFYMGSTEVLMHRKSDNALNADESSKDFYGWIWKADDGGVWAQEMRSLTWDEENEYTGRRFVAAAFAPLKLESGYYKYTDDVDRSLLLEGRRFNLTYPRMMCKLSTDGNGNITGIEEVDKAFYGMYDLEDREPEFSYQGTTFTINGYEINMNDYASKTDNILDCRRVGNWIIVECHIDPYQSAYEFYDINFGDFVYEILGASLKWQGDDLSTAAYFNKSQIFDFWGHLIGTVEDGEIYGLQIKDKNTIEAKCWAVDSNGNESEFSEEFEYEPEDKAVLEYYQAILGTNRQMKQLISDAPKGAVALVMVNPPERIIDKMPSPEQYDNGSYDRLAVLSLYDNVRLHIKSDEVNSAGKEKNYDRFHDVNKGEAAVFEITIPEGMPKDKLEITLPSGDLASWDITPISGRAPIMSEFICLDNLEETAKESAGKKIDSAGEKDQLSEADMLKLAKELGGIVCANEYYDYDGDGTKEMFVAIGEADEYDGYILYSIWFIGSDGKTKEMRTDFKDLSMYKNDNGYYMDYAAENKGFFYADFGGYGSGWLTLVFSVKDGKPYELDVSSKLQGLYQLEPGKFITTTSEFGDYHKYLITYLDYDKKTQQFSIGEITDEDFMDR